MNSHRLETRGDLGQPIGQLRSASEAIELGVLGVSLLVWLPLWHFEISGPILSIAGIVVTSGLLYLVSKLIARSWSVHDLGVEMRSMQSQGNVIMFDEVTAVSAKKTHYYQKDIYVGTKAEITVAAGSMGDFVLKTDYRRGNNAERVVSALVDRCSENVERRLLLDLRSLGEIHWADKIYLTATALRINDRITPACDVPFDDIVELKLEDNQLKIWKRGDVLPFMQLMNDEVNFIPKFRLFRSLTSKSHELSGQMAQVAAAV